MFLKTVAAVLAFFISIAQFVFTPDVIRIDFNNIIDNIRPLNGIDRMAEYEVDSEINKYYTEANMPYCRTHDTGVDIYRIFPDFSKDVNDESAYSFEESDKVIAAIIDTGMKPFFRLGTIAYVEPKIGIPDDFEKWAQICEHVILHYNEGWNNGFCYDIEYWEIWNEPDNGEDSEKNMFWQGTAEEFYRLYDVSAKYLKEKFPELKIGGYGSCGFYGLTNSNVLNTGTTAENKYFIEFFEGFIDYISTHGSPLDFFSWHCYTVTKRNARYIEYVKENLKKVGFGEAEIICDEWNYNPTENDKIDRRFGANQTSMLIMFQNEGLNMAHYYSGDNGNSLYSGLFAGDGVPSSAYYGFWAFGQLYKLGGQAEIKNLKLREDLYAAAAAGEDGQALLIANVSDKKDRKLKIDAGEYTVDRVMTVNENCEWVEIAIPDKIESGSMLYITFKK